MPYSYSQKSNALKTAGMHTILLKIIVIFTVFPPSPKKMRVGFYYKSIVITRSTRIRADRLPVSQLQKDHIRHTTRQSNGPCTRKRLSLLIIITLISIDICQIFLELVLKYLYTSAHLVPTTQNSLCTTITPRVLSEQIKLWRH